jgi:hypothetical protein
MTPGPDVQIAKFPGRVVAPDAAEPKAVGKIPKRFLLTRFNDIRLDTTSTYLVKGLIPRTGIVVIWGPPKCGKSFWVFDLVMRVAMNGASEYRGRRVPPLRRCERLGL